MARSWVIALFEVRGYLRDRADLAFSLLLPVAIFALMYGAFGGQSHFYGTAYVVDEDRGYYAADFIDGLDKLDNLDVELLTAQDAQSRLQSSDLLMVIQIPEGFSSKLAAGEQARLIFRQRGNGGNEGQIVASLARGVAEEMGQEIAVKSQVKAALADKGIASERIDFTVDRLFETERQSPTVDVTERLTGAEIDLPRQFLPGIITMFVLFSVTLTGRALVEERRKGTLERLLTTQLGVGQLFGGKFLANVFRGFVQTFILLSLAYAVFRFFTPLTFLEALAIALIFAAAVSTLGLIIGSLARTEDQAVWVAVFFTMATTMLGGTFFPIPEGSVLAAISKASINTYANAAFKLVIAQGGSLSDLALELGVLAGVAVVGLIISRLIFRSAPGGR